MLGSPSYRRFAPALLLGLIAVTGPLSAQRTQYFEPDAGGGGGTNTANEDSPLGVNLDFPRYWSSEMPFVDAMRLSTEWLPQDVAGTQWNTGEALDLDQRGWVRSLRANQAAAKAMLVDNPGHVPPGDYTLLWTGDGDLQVRGATVVRSAPGRMVVNVQASARTVVIRVTRTNPANYVRDIRFVMPGFEATYEHQPFHPRFFANWRKAKVLRFLNYQATNTTTVGSWAERTHPDDDTQGKPGGVAVEWMVAMCNHFNADAWFCMPHVADDDYVRNFATVVRNQLRPGLKVYVEHSNEVWNSVFPQHLYCAHRGQALGYSTVLWEAAWSYHAQRSREIWDIFESAMGGRNRMVRVLGSFISNADVTRRMLNHPGVSARTDAVAIAPYVGGRLGQPSRVQQTLAMSVEDILRELRDDIPRVMAGVGAHLQLVRPAGIKLIGYEGGQHLAGVGSANSNAQLTALFIAVNRAPGMQLVYEQYLAAWRNSGAELMALLGSTSKPSAVGSWGLLEYQDSDLGTMPKYRAYDRFIDANPRWW